MIDKKVEDITIKDINQLLNDDVVENRFLEYKREIDGGKYRNDEFLADFVAFANSSGGDLIIGIEEGKGSDKGKPIAIVGIPIKSIEDDRIALNNTIRDKVYPRFMDFEVRYIDLNNGNYIVIIRIKQSWNKPHMINGASRDFFVRNTTGKHAMDISEIKNSIFATQTVREQMIEFMKNRLCNIISSSINDIVIKESPRIVVHLIPFASFSEDTPSIPINAMEAYSNKNSDYAIQNRINFDGKFILNNDGHAEGFTQLFRNGIVEYVKAVPVNQSTVKLFNPIIFKEIFQNIDSFLQYLSASKIDVPIRLSISLIGFRGIGLSSRNTLNQKIGKTIDRDLITLPDISITDYNVDIMNFLNDSLSIISNAFGMTDIGWEELLGWSQN